MAIGWPDIELVIPPDVHTLPNFLRWAHSDDYPEQGNIAFISGELVLDMSPEQIESHVKVKGRIYFDLCQLASTLNSGEVLADGALLVNETVGLACEPDVSYSHWETLKTGRVRYAASLTAGAGTVELRGSPDLVVEVISNSSVRKDRKLLLKKYFEAGINEYWLVDA